MGSGSDGKDSQGNVAYNINTNGANIAMPKIFLMPEEQL